MKSSMVASLLLGSLALAAPLEKRARETSTVVVTETLVVYTTVYDGDAEPTADGGAFYEVKPSSPVVTPALQTPAVESPLPEAEVVEAPTSATSSSSTSSSSSSTVVVVPSTTTPAPSVTAAAPSVQEQPKPTTVQQAATNGQASSGGSGQVYKGGSLTLNYYQGGLGACGDPVDDSSMAVALAVDTFGDSQPDYMTGKNMNPWCGKQIAITNNGVTVNAKIVDRCPGCTGAGLDATPALWDRLTGGMAGDRIYTATWKVIS